MHAQGLRQRPAPRQAWPGRSRPRAMSRATAREMRRNSGVLLPDSRARGRSRPRMTGRSYFTKLAVSRLPVVGQDGVHERAGPSFYPEDPDRRRPARVLTTARSPTRSSTRPWSLGRLRPGRRAVRHPDGGREAGTGWFCTPPRRVGSGRFPAGARICATVTLLDGLVFARSAMHHSMNYRSVVVWAPRPRSRRR